MKSFKMTCFILSITTAISGLCGYILSLFLHQVLLGWIGSGIMGLMALKLLEISRWQK